MTITRILPLLLILISSLCAQSGLNVNVSRSASPNPFTRLFFYDGSSQLEYICVADKVQPKKTWSIAGSTLTSIVDSSNTSTITTATAHGLLPGNQIVIEGATIDTDLNGTYVIATTPTTTTFTITTASVSDATYNEASLLFHTRAPRTSDLQWSITKYRYDGSGNLISEQNSDAPQICDNRASIKYE